MTNKQIKALLKLGKIVVADTYPPDYWIPEGAYGENRWLIHWYDASEGKLYYAHHVLKQWRTRSIWAEANEYGKYVREIMGYA
jgi:hypothetical protein